jgi:hypothetical protein
MKFEVYMAVNIKITTSWYISIISKEPATPSSEYTDDESIRFL